MEVAYKFHVSTILTGKKTKTLVQEIEPESHTNW
jgi:hypothetical protein